MIPAPIPAPINRSKRVRRRSRGPGGAPRAQRLTARQEGRAAGASRHGGHDGIQPKSRERGPASVRAGGEQPLPSSPYLSWMPLANPWGIQVGDTDLCTRPPMQVGVYGKGTGGCFWGPFAFLNSSGSTPDSTGNTTV